ncbi:L-seryl-tRNA(Sec) selenium transferase [Peribacillus alkalitolerans]|uniref:L-seryl-tRNA(Sec) selenium transferase n=1 Tax=Peribacillus alkalitolerans TaxID=1550385 RepID=UPI0013D1EA7B|nr:L-seryl-tRNA(Sec) selenium transferase [Peribacillus alkalitolerans]
MNHLLRTIPPVHELQKLDSFSLLREKFKLDIQTMTELVRKELLEMRKSIIEDEKNCHWMDKSQFIEGFFKQIELRLQNKIGTRLKRVINATGTVLHTNLGRAPLSQSAIDQVVDVARHYTNLEYNQETGERGSRHSHIEYWITEITGAEAAIVVNNNAAAVYFILKALSKNKEVIVSRGELVEIGGSFRISSIMEESGAKLKEVGTTNKTHLFDYENAINEETGMIMKVHTSNFKTIGFTKSVTMEELMELHKKNPHIIYYEDLGSGVLYDLSQHGIGEEPLVKQKIKSGADLISFSGDKLLGGPQAGIIAGKKKWIDLLKKHQLARVLRVDKMTLAALEATLAEYVNEENVIKRNPVLRDILTNEDTLKEKASTLQSKLSEIGAIEVRVASEFSKIGGGSLPDIELPTYVITMRIPGITTATVHKALRTWDIPIVSRIKNDRIILDVRTLQEDDFSIISEAIVSLLTR